MIDVAVVRTTPSYAGLRPPYHPGVRYPELTRLFGPDDDGTRNSACAVPGNGVYAAVRAALRGLGLDGERFGSPEWNPLSALVRRGSCIVLKPNFIRHWNPCADGSPESVITHGSVLRAAADYAFLAAGPEGRVVIAEAPQQDCDFARIRALCGLDALIALYRERAGRTLEVIDLRREAVEFRDGIVVRRERLPGDPAGYRAVDLGAASFFCDSGLDPARFRGADYDPEPTAAHHSGGRHEYLLSETVLRSDLVVNLPKLKTHKKTGVTLAIKNLVGINGDKNWLPHHALGAATDGGDEFPGRRLRDRLRSRAIDWARPHLARARFLGAFRAARRLEDSVRGQNFIRSGNWYGNRTTWRMCLDLNRCLYYSDEKGLHLSASGPVRRVLTVLDGVVAGEGDGPLAPRDVPLGLVMAGCDPVAVDLAAIRAMGFDEQRIPKVREAMRDCGARITHLCDASEVRLVEVSADDFGIRVRELDELLPERPFLAHPGWRGFVERRVA
jgi:uncharacterized protein (DUF362 family)